MGARPNQGRRCIMQFSYDCAPKALYDENLISQAKGTMSQSQISDCPSRTPVFHPGSLFSSCHSTTKLGCSEPPTTFSSGSWSPPYSVDLYTQSTIWGDFKKTINRVNIVILLYLGHPPEALVTRRNWLTLTMKITFMMIFLLITHLTRIKPKSGWGPSKLKFAIPRWVLDQCTWKRSATHCILTSKIKKIFLSRFFCH